MDCINKLETNSKNLQFLHRGKVRDSFRVDATTRLIVVTDRISAFNKKIKTPIPDKGAVLNGIANFWFEKTAHIIPNHVIRMIDPNMMLVKEAEPIRIEMVVRGYLTGSIWRGYEAGERIFSGVEIKEGMSKNQKFDTPIITPTTKDEDDTPISAEEILKTKLVSPEIWQQLTEKTLALFNFSSKYLLDRGIILVDTKYEFGLLDGQLILIDEIQTPDSSRFWQKSAYESNPTTVEQMDKEFVRQWMLANKVNGEVPLILTPEIIQETSQRYKEIYQMVLGTSLTLPELTLADRVRKNLLKEGLLTEHDFLNLN